MEYRKHLVPRGRYRIYAREYEGEEPAIVLMHGFRTICTSTTGLCRTSWAGGSFSSTSSAGGGQTSRGVIRIRQTTRPATSTP
jgi:hypothetical protein